jgi:DNA repair protein RecO (recombination protein O)
MTGIVLKEMPLGEADKLLTVFSREQGRISVVAKGAKKPGSRFLAAASAFAYSDMELVKGRSMYVLRNANIISPFYGLREDLDVLTAAAETARLTLKVIQEDLPDPETLELLLKVLSFLEQKKRSPRLRG